MIIIDVYIRYYFKYVIFSVSWTFSNYLRILECCPVMSDNDRAAMTKRTSLPADQMSWVLRILFVDGRFNKWTVRILSHCRKNAVIYWGNGKWNSMNCFFCDNIRDFFSSLFYKLTKRSSNAADQMSWVLFQVICWRQNLLMQCILSHFRKHPLIYSDNCQVEPNQLINLW